LRSRGFFVVVHRQEVMQRLMQISRPDRSGEAHERLGGDGVLTLRKGIAPCTP